MFLWISPDFTDLPEFRGFVTTRNIRSPVILRSIPTDNPPIPGNVGYTTGVYVPYSRAVVWVLLYPTRIRWVKALWDGTYGFSSLSKKTRKDNHLQMSLQRQHFLLSYLKTLSVGQVAVFYAAIELIIYYLANIKRSVIRGRKTWWWWAKKGYL